MNANGNSNVGMCEMSGIYSENYLFYLLCRNWRNGEIEIEFEGL